MSFALWSVLYVGPASNEFEPSQVSVQEIARLITPQDAQEKTNVGIKVFKDISTQKRGAEHQTTLPIAIRLIGTQSSMPQIALIESDGIAKQFQIGDKVFSFDIELVDIASQHAIVAFNNTPFTIVLIGPNLLNSEPEQSYQAFENMSVEEIGNRPRILEHVITFSASETSGKSAFASVGINPKLFAQAGLQEDDLIKSINDKDITDPEQLAQLQSLIPHADTLIFKVERDGRIITLYLDIPSRALNIQ
jgi:general secretion pathway protein C